MKIGIYNTRGKMVIKEARSSTDDFKENRRQERNVETDDDVSKGVIENNSQGTTKEG